MTLSPLSEHPIQDISWDICDIASFQAEELLQAGECATEQEAFAAALADELYFELAFADFLEDLTSVLRTISPDGYFHVEGRNMGWRHLSGHLGVQAMDARAFIDKAFPHTHEWTFKGTYDPADATLHYQLYHHDAPTGESYTLRQGVLCPSTEEILRVPPALKEGRGS